MKLQCDNRQPPRDREWLVMEEIDEGGTWNHLLTIGVVAFFVAVVAISLTLVLR